MTAQLMSGTDIARAIADETAQRAAAFTAAHGRQPCLATVIAGDDPASVTYVRMKRNRSAQVGIDSRLVALPADITTAGLVAEIRALSADPGIDGILLQHPVPKHIDERAAFEAIDPAKDVDGVTMHSFAAMAFGRLATAGRAQNEAATAFTQPGSATADPSQTASGFASATPGAIMRLLDAYGIDPTGRHAVVIGRSPILGKPAGMLLLARDATVTYCHSKTVGLPAILGTADIVVAAVGKPEFVRGEHLKEGVVVVDAGYNPGNVGDVHFESAARKASFITPVPGGVGPVTIAVLLEQTVTAAVTRTARHTPAVARANAGA